MAYARPTYKRRAPARKYQTKSTYKKRATVSSLDAKVRKVVRSMAGLKSTVQYGLGVNNEAIGNAGGSNIYIKPLSQYSGWTRIFGADADDESNHSAIWKKSNLDLEIDADLERNSIDYSFYIVSLTKLGFSELFTPSSGGLAGPLGITSLTPNRHFSQGSAAMTLLNRKYFNILSAKRLITGTGGSVAYETASLRKRWYVKMAHNKGTGHRLQNPNGDWKASVSPLVPNQNMYILIFNNDSTVDASVKFRMTCIHTVDIV
jgi:hypothetical protein